MIFMSFPILFANKNYRTKKSSEEGIFLLWQVKVASLQQVLDILFVVQLSTFYILRAWMMNDFDWCKFNEIGEHVKSVYNSSPVCLIFRLSSFVTAVPNLPYTLQKVDVYKSNILESFVYFLNFNHTFSTYRINCSSF